TAVLDSLELSISGLATAHSNNFKLGMLKWTYMYDQRNYHLVWHTKNQNCGRYTIPLRHMPISNKYYVPYSLAQIQRKIIANVTSQFMLKTINNVILLYFMSTTANRTGQSGILKISSWVIRAVISKFFLLISSHDICMGLYFGLLCRFLCFGHDMNIMFAICDSYILYPLLEFSFSVTHFLAFFLSFISI
ncbi:hypothetical protein ACJX0J_033783, partial [Zea mays]